VKYCQSKLMVGSPRVLNVEFALHIYTHIHNELHASASACVTFLKEIRL
jgi:hypothetical protein